MWRFEPHKKPLTILIKACYLLHHSSYWPTKITSRISIRNNCFKGILSLKLIALSIYLFTIDIKKMFRMIKIKLLKFKLLTTLCMDNKSLPIKFVVNFYLRTSILQDFSCSAVKRCRDSISMRKRLSVGLKNYSTRFLHGWIFL